jgi:hypothetical protein
LYTSLIQNINQYNTTKYLIVDTTTDISHEINIKGFVVKDAFSTFDIIMKSNNLTVTKFNDLNKCGNVDPKIYIYSLFYAL